MSTISEIKAPIKDELARFNQLFKEYLYSKTSLLNYVVRYMMKSKGKQIRPSLVLLSAKLFENLNDSSYRAAILLELMHNATLIHDDVVDEADKRRGLFSINALWKNKIAVLVGDYLLAKGLSLSVKEGEYRHLEILSDTVQEMSEGELLQMEKSRGMNFSESVYFEIIQKKTASLMAACTSLGAVAAGCNDKDVEQMRLFGEKLGLAFQIKDDLFDYQKSSKTGKPKGNDIKEKKMTLPIIYALNHAPSKDAKTLKRRINKYHKDNNLIEEVVDFAQKHGGINYAEQVMQNYKNEALEILDQYPNGETKTALISLLSYIVDRKK